MRNDSLVKIVLAVGNWVRGRAGRGAVNVELHATATLTSPLLPGFALPVAEIFGG